MELGTGSSSRGLVAHTPLSSSHPWRTFEISKHHRHERELQHHRVQGIFIERLLLRQQKGQQTSDICCGLCTVLGSQPYWDPPLMVEKETWRERSGCSCYHSKLGCLRQPMCRQKPENSGTLPLTGKSARMKVIQTV